jgi:glycerol-3-phosphate O-acyltransferase
MLAELRARGVDVPEEGAAALIAGALPQLLRRGIVQRKAGVLTVRSGQEAMLAYYANTIAHHFADAGGEVFAAPRD